MGEKVHTNYKDTTEYIYWILKTKVYLMLENGESNKSPDKLSIWYSLDIVFNWLTINQRKAR